MPSKRNLDPRTHARKLLEDLGFRNAPIPVDKIAKSLGAQIRFSPLDEELSGMIYVKDGDIIIGVNSLHHPNRQRFTIAHELGHLCLHRDIISNTVHVDKQFRVLRRDSKSATGTDRIEIEANQFAAELLMPKFLLEPLLTNTSFDIEDERPVEEVAKKFRVSKQTLEYQISNMFG